MRLDATTRDALAGAVLLLAIGSLVGLAAAAESSEPDRVVLPRPRNIVLIVIDTLRADVLGAYGHPLDTSPELDALAERGVRFDRVLSQSSWTRPSFASMLTSLPPRASGISQERRHVLPEPLVTLPEVLDEAGYTTVGITANPNINSTFGFAQGFDHYIDSGVRFNWMQAAAQEGDELAGRVPLMTSRVVFERLLEALEEHVSADRPTYVQIDLMDVHERLDRRVLFEEHRDSFPGHPHNPYLSSVRQVSAEIQAFIEELERRPEFAERTLYVITSDHGEGLGSHPHVHRGRDHGYHVYESQVAVPLIFYHSGGALPRGHVVEEPVRLLDLMPTLLDLADAREPDVMVGRSLRPLLAQRRIDMPDLHVVETRFRQAHAVGVYGERFAYIEHRRPWRGTDRRELQPIGAPQDGSRTNVIAEHPEVAERLRGHLRAWERDNPAADPTSVGAEISRDELEQLRALGYVE